MLEKPNETFTIVRNQCTIDVVKEEILRIVEHTARVIECLTRFETTSSVMTVMLSQISSKFRTGILRFARRRIQVKIFKTCILGLISDWKKEEKAALPSWKMTKHQHFDIFISTLKSFIALQRTLKSQKRRYFLN